MADLASRVTQPPAEDAPAQDAPAQEAAESNGEETTAAGGPGLWDSEAKIQVALTDLQSDENTPFYSATTFEDLKL